MQTLDQLLDTLGKEPEIEKTASPDNTGDLISRLRKEAQDTGVQGAPVDIRAAAQQELVEKTAEIGIIAMTLAELEQAGLPTTIKTASIAPVASPTARHRSMAVFIKSALERGHSPDEIAGFLHKQAGLGDAVKDIAEAWKPRIAPIIEKAKAVGGDVMALAKQKMADPAFRRKAMIVGGIAGAGVGGYDLGSHRKKKNEAPDTAD